MFIRIIIYRNERHLDFHTITFLMANNIARTTLWRYLKRNRKIKSYIVKNERIYCLSDLLSDSFLVQNMTHIQDLDDALKEK